MASGYHPELFALFDRASGDFEILLAVVVPGAAGDETGIERGSDDERDVLPSHGREKFVHGVGVIDQRILPGAQTYVGIGVVHDLQDGLWRVHSDAPSPYDSLVAHLRQRRKGALPRDLVLFLPAV